MNFNPSTINRDSLQEKNMSKLSFVKKNPSIKAGQVIRKYNECPVKCEGGEAFKWDEALESENLPEKVKL